MSIRGGREMSTIAELEDKVKELMKEIETLKQKEKSEKFEYPFEEKEEYWSVGVIWSNHEFDTKKYDQGHIFKTEQEAIRERDKRALLTRFRQFRDKCNGDWTPDENSNKYCLALNRMDNVIKIRLVYTDDTFSLFGYFKNTEDAERAIELFGDEIKRLYAEE